MRILVTNDDGIAAAGIARLARAATETADEVVIAAPAGERSGSSAALSMVESSQGMDSEQVSLPGLPEVSAYGVDSSPALIVILACRGVFGTVPDLVLSGVNHGPNTGRSVLHSGTVGAAFTAVAHGIPAISFSSVATTSASWNTTDIVTRRIIRWFTAQRPAPSTVLNVNLPDRAPADFKGLRRAHLAVFGSSQAQLQRPSENVTMTVSESVGRPDPDTDDALLDAGFATITPVAAPCEIAAELPDLPTGS